MQSTSLSRPAPSPRRGPPSGPRPATTALGQLIDLGDGGIPPDILRSTGLSGGEVQAHVGTTTTTEFGLTMLRTDLVYAYEHEVSAQVLEAPPPAAIQAMQGERGDEAKAGQALLDSLLVAEVTRLRADIAARDRGETDAEDAP